MDPALQVREEAADRLRIVKMAPVVPGLRPQPRQAENKGESMSLTWATTFLSARSCSPCR